MKMVKRPRSESETVTVYRANIRHELGIFRIWVVMISNMIKSRSLLWQLFKRDFLAQYKKSFLGITWVIAAPVLGILSWVFLQSTGLLQPGDVGVPYPVFVLLGTAMWSLYMGFFNAAMQTLKAGEGFIMQVNFPHEVLLIKQSAQHLATFSITLVLNFVVLFAFDIVPSWKVVFFPLVILPLFFLATAIGLVASMVGVVAVDISKFLEVSMGMVMYLTPVIYSERVANPLVQQVIAYNPLTYLISSARDIILYGRLYDPVGYAMASGFAVVLFFLSWRLFFVSEDRLVERMI